MPIICGTKTTNLRYKPKDEDRTTRNSSDRSPTDLGEKKAERSPMTSSPRTLLVAAILLLTAVAFTFAQDYTDDPEQPKAVDSCHGIFLTYTFISRSKEYPRVKNASAQGWAFKSMATVLNAMKEDLPAWKMYIGFQHEEVLVSASGAVLTEGTDLPAKVGNGTYLSGFPQADLKNSIETAGDLNQIMVQVELSGTQFGVKPPAVPMPKTVRLANVGYKCPAPTRHKSQMYVCCEKDPKYKQKKKTTKFQPRRNGDLTIDYDVLQAFEGSYMAQVTINNNSPLGRLDNWNLTWEWMRGEFIHDMRGAYTLRKDPSSCIYGDAGAYYKDMDFSTVASCEKKPIMVDLPPERANDTQVGKLPYCCKNGTLLPPNMDPERSMAVFQLRVFKVPPDINRTILHCPQKWKINGVLNPHYNCTPPVRVSPSGFPDPSGLMTRSYAIASWQVVCNITRPKKKESRCCVSFSAFYNDSVIPCGTCACGCPAGKSACNRNAPPLLLPPEALLIPFDNRTAKAKAWAKIKHRPIPNPLPCGDHCGVSINWHIFSNYAKGWTARITLFNWEEYIFKDWFAAVQMKEAFKGYEKTYSFNGTKLKEINDTIFFQGLPGLNYVMGEVDGKDKKHDPRVPGKQQSVLSFTKKQTPGINVVAGDGFPSRVYFNGEECALPGEIPMAGAPVRRGSQCLLVATMLVALVLLFSLEDLW